MTSLFLLPGARRHDPAVEAWFDAVVDTRMMTRHWFALVRDAGPDVTEIMHDGQPTACLGNAAFAYVGAYAAHVSIGFFHGADLPDPAGLLQGSGKRMRHIKLRWGHPIDEEPVVAMIAAAYRDIEQRLAARE